MCLPGSFKRFALVLIALVWWCTPAVLGSVIVYPARIELEVPSSGTETELTFINRGHEAVQVRLSSGMGTHTVDGSPVYLDDLASIEESLRWIALDTDVLDLPAGQQKSAVVRFHPGRGAVSAYPMIFAELHPQGAVSDTPSAVMVPRVAIPVLLTFADSVDRRRVSTETVSITLREASDVEQESRVYEVRVVLRNTGNVHDVVRGHVDWLDSTGIMSQVASFDGHTILPNAERAFRTYWQPQGQRLDEVRLVATFFGNEWIGVARPATFLWKDGHYALADPSVETLLHASIDFPIQIEEGR